VTIDKRGEVRGAQVVKSVRALDPAAVDAVKKWKFAPTTAGAPVEVRTYLPVKFGQTPDFWASDFLEVARFYYERKLPGHADAALALARDTATRDALRYGRIFGPEGKDPPGFVWPKVVRDVKPKYTSVAMREKVQGVVKMQVLIDRSGAVGRVSVIQPLRLLTVAAQQAAFAWKFSTGTLDGQPVSVVAELVLEFRLH
jgi:TonB family protein